jgi:protein-S-isoprenylcysteine O-methyltransferase Ste14
MEEELLLRLLIVGTWAIFGAIRIRYRLPASRRAAGDKYEPNRIVMGILSFGIVAYIVTLILYAVYIPLILWFSFSLPSVIRWLGVVAALLCTPFLYWTHSTLDKQYSADLSIKDGHNLIEIGPYRKVRHPMYTVFIVFTISIAIITANVLCIIFSLLISCSFPSIAKSEELMLIDAFGDEYNSYMGRTGRFFPPLRLNS